MPDSDDLTPDGFLTAAKPVSEADLERFRQRWDAVAGTPFGPVWRARQPGGFSRTPLVCWWRYKPCRWFCRWPLLCRLARHVREEWTP